MSRHAPLGTATAFKTQGFETGRCRPKEHVMAAFDVPAELELLYAGFLERNSDKSRQFVREVSRYFIALARRYAWSLPADVRQEVVNESLLALLSPDAREYDPARGTVKKYLTGFVLNAI